MTCLMNGAPDAHGVTMLVEAHRLGAQRGAENAAVGQVEGLGAVLGAQTGEQIVVGIAVLEVGRIVRARAGAQC